MPILPPPPPPPESANSLSRLIRTTLSYDTNVMLAAIISLLLVILFVLLLHLYTRWFLLQARRRSRSSATVPRVLGSRLQRFTIIDTSNSDPSAKLGLPFSIIASLPLFVHKLEPSNHELLDCAICLSVFEDEEIGRKLPGCGHAFHVACIDMWLHSHSTCPICRAAIHCNYNNRKIDRVEIEIDGPDAGLADELRLEIVTMTADLDVAEENNESGTGGSRSSSAQELQLPKKVLTGDSSSSNGSNNNSRFGGKVHPSLVVDGGEIEG